jgi:hypothetical protein
MLKRIGLFGDQEVGASARRDVGADVEQRLGIAADARFAAGQVNGDRQAVAVRAAKRLIVLPPLASAAETCARTTVESNICTRCGRCAHRSERCEERLERGRSGKC